MARRFLLQQIACRCDRLWWIRFVAAVGRGMTLCALVYLFTGVLSACQPKPIHRHRYISTSRLALIQHEPIVRVRIAKAVDELYLDGPKRLRFRSLDPLVSPAHQWAFATPVRIRHNDNAFVIQSGDGQSMTWKTSRVIVRPDFGSTIRVDGITYPQQIVLHRVKDPNGSNSDRFDVINHVAMEQYLPGVLQRELYRTWPLYTFRAQAIAARSYAIVESARNRRRHFDLESTTASQAYGGAKAHWRASQAVQQTRGKVIAYAGNVLPAYYSSCCGGVGQDASAAFPTESDMKPLWGRKHGGWCAVSPHFRWGPVLRSRVNLARRLAAWGRRRSNPIGALQAVADIVVTTNKHTGRSSHFTITDMTGRFFTLGSEAFRLACNYHASHLPQLSKAAMLKSGYVTVQISGDQVRFSGRGFGHGVGMCQWGAYAMAKRGHEENTILTFYYPGTSVRKLY